MRKPPRVILILVSLSLCLLFIFLNPTLVLKIRTPDARAMLYCAALDPGDEIFYDSINSIYDAPTGERWRVREDGAIQVLEVVSSAAVMEYYRLDGYQSAGTGVYRGEPKELIYRNVLMKVGARGKQRLIVRGQELALYQMVPEGAVIEIAVQRAPRLTACL